MISRIAKKVKVGENDWVKKSDSIQYYSFVCMQLNGFR